MDALDRSARTEVAALLKKLALGPATTYNQRACYLNEYLQFLTEVLEMPESRVRAADLVDLDYAAVWLKAAGDGYTRQRRTLHGPKASEGAQAARRATFNRFAQHLGMPQRLPVDQPASKALPVEKSRSIVAALAENRPPRTTTAVWERTSALAAMRLATGRPMSQLAAVDVGDVDLKATVPTVTLGEKPYPLDELAVRTAQRWLDRHALLTSELLGGEVHALWITTRPGRPRLGEPARHPYLPCSFRALWAAHHALTSRLLAEPTRLGQLTAPDPEERAEELEIRRRRPAPPTPPPSLSPAERKRALEKAAAVRQERALLLSDLKAGRVSIGDVLARVDRTVGMTRVGRLVEALPGTGPAKRGRLLSSLGVEGHRRVQGLSEQQRQELLRLCSADSGLPTAG
ncbi:MULTISPECIES: integration host factor, actinobacterial type [unclassified Streptomyces]|uniref:integration host factor, actinobacterial type n=1 Tax=unclassified Streptomyces TaxID=2593676 RepID=UPI003795E492